MENARTEKCNNDECKEKHSQSCCGKARQEKAQRAKLQFNPRGWISRGTIFKAKFVLGSCPFISPYRFLPCWFPVNGATAIGPNRKGWMLCFSMFMPQPSKIGVSETACCNLHKLFCKLTYLLLLCIICGGRVTIMHSWFILLLLLLGRSKKFHGALKTHNTGYLISHPSGF